MKLAPRQPEEPHIDLTSLIDVVFLLLIFFMVTTTFVRDANLKVSLPQADQAAQPPDSRSIEVAVDARGRYFINGRELRDSSSETLQRGLVQVAGEERGRPLVIRADGRSTHQAVVTVMDVAGRLGFRRLSIATSATDQQP